MMNVVEEWEKIYGKKFIEKIGVCPGDSVIDIGCNIGRYTIVLAQVVGDRGIVYAIDSDKKPLTQLKKRIKNTELEDRIKIINNDGIPEDIKEESIDFVLLYDMLHYLEREERINLYQDINVCLKSITGILSIHPKHTKDDDFPFWNFKDITLKELVMEVESFGEFLYEKRICDILWHRNSIESSCVYNFVKKTE